MDNNSENKKLMATVSQAVVVGVKDINMTTHYGMVPSLPGTVYATLSDGRKLNISVIWDSSAKDRETYKANQDVITIYGMTKSYGNAQVSATITIIKIVSVEFKKCVTQYGVVPPNMPVAYITNSVGGKPGLGVKWDNVAKLPSTYETNVDEVTINGVITDYGDYPVSTTITVLRIISMDDITTSTKYGIMPILPSAHVTLSNDAKVFLSVNWNSQAKISANYQTQASSVQINGRLAGYDKRDVTGTVNIINVDSIDDISGSTHYGLVPTYMPSAHVTLNDGKRDNVGINWEASAKLRATYATYEKSIQIRGTLGDYDKREVTGTINIVNIDSIEPIVRSTPKGAVPSLPNSVTATLTNGNTQDVGIQWSDEARNKETYNVDSGTVTVYGTVDSYDKRTVTATVNVITVTSISDINITTNYGSVPYIMPNLVKVTLSNGTTPTVSLEWNEEAKTASTYETTANTITISGKLVSYGHPSVTATVNIINVVSIDDIYISTKYGEVPELPGAHVSLNNGKRDLVGIKWDSSATSIETYKTADQVVTINGNLIRYDKRPVTAKVTVINISSLDSIVGKTVYGRVPQYMPDAHATLSDGRNTVLNVAWDDVAKSPETYMTYNPTVLINGTIANYDKRAVTGTITVLNVSSMPEINRFTPVGIVPSLPSRVSGVLNNGETRDIYITWDARAKSAETYKTNDATVIVNGTLDSYDKRSVQATINVLAVSGISDINLSTSYGIVPSLPGSVKVTLSDGTIRNPSVVWEDIARLEETYMTNSSSIKINGKLVNYGDLPVTADVTIRNVASVDNITCTTRYGQFPEVLPDAHVTLNDGSNKFVSVIWDDDAKLSATYRTYNPTVTINGKLRYYDKRAVTCTVTVLNVSSMPEIIRSTPNGIVPSLPSLIKAVLNNGETKDVDIDWDKSAISQETYRTNAASIIVNGNLRYYDNRSVTATINILTVNKIEDINEITNYGIVPSLNSTVEVTLSDGTKRNPTIIWEDSAKLAQTYMTNEPIIKVNGRLVNYGELPVTATVKVINISDVEEINYTTLYGEVPKISNAYVTLNDGTKKYVQIAWNDVAKSVDTYKTTEHTIVIHGNLTYYDKREITATITIIPEITLLDPIKLTTKYGEVPDLPEYVNVTITTGETVKAKVTWRPAAKDAATYKISELVVTVYGYLADYSDRVVTAVVTIASVSSVSDINLSTTYGQVPELPATVQVTFSDGNNANVPVSWEKKASLASTYTVSAESVTINGTMVDYGNKAVTAVVTIKPGVISVDKINLTTNYGEVPVLPATVSVGLSNGTTLTTGIFWEIAAKSPSTYEKPLSQIVISGTLPSYNNKPISATVNITFTITSVNPINLTTNYGVAPILQPTAYITLNNVIDSTTQITWEQAAKAASTYETKDKTVIINGVLASYGNRPITATVTVKPKVNSVGNVNISTINGTKPALPQTVSVTLSDGSTVQARVIWDAAASSDNTYKTTAGTVTINGTLLDYENKVITVTINIKPSITLVNTVNLSTLNDAVPTLPDTINITLSNGTTTNAKIIWDFSAKAKETYDTTESTVTISGTLPDYENQKVTVIVNVKPSIKSIKPINLVTKYGVAPTLPVYATVDLSNGTTQNAEITWAGAANSPDAYKTKEASVKVIGTLADYGNKDVIATVSIIPVCISVDAINLITDYGVVPTLPITVGINLSNGTKSNASITWAQSALLPITYETKDPAVIVFGTLPDCDNTVVRATVTVNPKAVSVDSISLTTNYGVVPTLPSTVSVTLSNGTAKAASITWGQAATLAETYKKKESTVIINGTLAAYGNMPITATVTVIPKLVSVAPINLTTPYGVVPTLPSIVSVTLSNGTTKATSIAWAQAATLPSTYETKEAAVTIYGVLPDYNNEPIRGTVSVIPKLISVAPINLTTPYGVVPTLPSTVGVTLSNGTIPNAVITWGQAATLEATYKTNESTVIIQGTLAAYGNTPITATVTIIPKFISAAPINLTTPYGVVPTLPNTVGVTLSDGTTKTATIAWAGAASLSATYETKEAAVTIYGTLPEYNNELIKGTVTVIPKLMSVAPVNLITNYGVAPALPDTVGVNFSNGTKGTASALWEDAARAAATYKTKDKTVTIKGKLKDYDNRPITGTVTIIPLKEDLKEQIHYGEEGVNPATGNLARNYTDMIINQASPNMNVTRTYNGKDKRENRPLGRGWTFGFEGSVTDYSDAVPIKIVRLPNGSIATFNPNGDGSFTANDSRNTLVQKEDGSYVVTAKDQNSFGFNADGYLCWIKDRYGNVTNISVDKDGKVTAVKDPVGRSLAVAYNGGLIASVTDGMGRTVTYGYTNNLLTSAKGPAGKVINYKYNEQQLLSEIRDTNSNLIESITYIEDESPDSMKVDTVTDNFGNVKKYTYDKANKSSTITDSNGRTVTTYTDDLMYTIKSVDAEGKETITAYDIDASGNNNFGEEKSVTDRNGNTTKYVRDKNGNITSQVNPDNSSKTFVYDVKNNKLQETDEAGNNTFYVYDTDGIYLLKKVQPLNGKDIYKDNASDASKFAITEFSYFTDSEAAALGYGLKGLLKQVKDPNGNATTYTYDAQGNIKTATNAENEKASFEYNDNGWKLAAISSRGKKTKYSYDNNGSITKVELDKGETTSTAYDIEGRKLKEISANQYGGTDVGTRYTYNGDGTLKAVKDAEDNVTSYTYDLYGNVLTVTKPDGSIYSYDYDVMNRVAHEYYQGNASAPKVTLVDYSYDILEGGNTKKKEIRHLNDKDTAETVSIYDYANRPIEQHNPDGTKMSVKYNPNGTKAENTDAAGNVAYYKYDGLNRLTEQWVPFEDNGGILYNYSRVDYDKGSRKVKEVVGKDKVALYAVPSKEITISYDYHNNNKLQSQTDSSGRRTDYVYDADGNVAKITSHVDETTQNITEFENNHMGKPEVKSIHVRKGDIYGNSFEDNEDTVIKTNYTYDANGNVKTMTTADGVTTTYSYDNLNRETSISQPGIDEKGKAVTIKTSTTYNYAGKPLTQTDANNNTTSFTYDGRGNLIRVKDAKGNTAASYYDIGNRKTADVAPKDYVSGSDLSSMNRTEYSYDLMGRLITVKSVYTENVKADNSNVATNLFAASMDKASAFESSLAAFESQAMASKYSVTALEDNTKDVSSSGIAASENNSAILKDSASTSDNKAKAGQYGAVILGTLKYNAIASDANTDEPGTQRSIVTKAYAYDASGNVIKELDALGYAIGKGSTVSDIINSGYGTVTTYNLANKPITVQTPDTKDRGIAATITYSYDGAGRKLSETNAAGVVTEFSYDDAGRLLSTTVKKDASAAGKVIKASTYDGEGNVITETDGRGNVVTYEYNALNKVKTVSYPGDSSIDKYTVSYQYDVNGNLKSKTDSLGKQSIYTYDNQGRLLSTLEQASDGTNPITLSTAYDKVGNKRFVTDGNGNTTESVYDELNKLVSTSITVNSVIKKVSYGYDANGNKTSETDWIGNVTQYKYDPLNRLVKTIDANGKTIETLEYYDNGAQSISYDALNNATKFFYDKDKRLIKTIAAENNITEQSYDAVGNIASKTDGNGNVTSYLYDEFNKLVKVINAKKEETTYSYDLNGNMLSQTDAKGNVTTFEYNVANKEARRIDNGGNTGSNSISNVSNISSINGGGSRYDSTRTESYTYFADGKLKTRTDRNGVVTTYTYDVHGRKLSESVGSINITYTYDSNGNQLTIKDATGTTTRSYDALNRVTSKDVPSIGKSDYVYDIIKDMEQGTYGESTTDPQGNATLKVYDKVGRLSKVTADGKTTTYNYFDNGSVNSVVYPNGSKENYGYYDNNLTRSLVNRKADGTITDSYRYEYDGAHNMTKKVDGKGVTAYTYDQLNRLKTITESEGTVTTYEYDGAGNRSASTIAKGSDTTVTTYSYNDQNRLIGTTKTVNGATTETEVFTYDHNGNQLTSTKASSSATAGATQITNNTYNEFNELVKTITPEGKNIVNTYNGEGIRVEKVVDGTSRKYLYEGDKVILELDGSGVVAARNIYGTNLLSRIVSGIKGYYLYNGHSDVTNIVGEDGSVLSSYYYDEFGILKASTGNFDNQYKYAGYQHDSETGTYYLMARMYNPMTARFLQEDSYRGDSRDPLSLNLYTYCVNNPIVYADPTGHWPDLLDGVKNWVGSKIAEAGNAISGAASAVGNTISNVVSTVVNAVKDPKQALTALGDGISSGYSKAKDKLMSTANAAVDSLKGISNAMLVKNQAKGKLKTENYTKHIPTKEELTNDYFSDWSGKGRIHGLEKAVADFINSITKPHSDFGPLTPNMYAIPEIQVSEETPLLKESKMKYEMETFGGEIVFNAGMIYAQMGADGFAAGFNGISKVAKNAELDELWVEKTVEWMQKSEKLAKAGKNIAGSANELKPTLITNLQLFANKGTGNAKTLFRGDRSTVTPDIVFDKGFTPKGSHNDLELHVTSNTTAGNFISTTSEKGIAEQFAGKNGYVYEVETSNYLDVNSVLGGKSPFPEQMEHAIPGGINPSEIKGAWVMKKGVPTGKFIPNPGFGR